MEWSELMTGDARCVVDIEGLTVTLRPMKAGELADCCKEGDMDIFHMISSSVVEPAISAESVRGLTPKVFARLAEECHKINGTDEDLE